jgi:dUTPase
MNNSPSGLAALRIVFRSPVLVKGKFRMSAVSEGFLMTTKVQRSSSESQQPDFHQEKRVKFKELMQLGVLLSKRPRKAIAADMEVCQASLCDWLNPDERSSMPAHHLASWTREVGNGALKWIAKENGLGLVDEDESGPVEVQDSAQLLALIAIHHGKLMGQIIQAREDGIIDDDERTEIWPAICCLIRELEAEAEYFRPRTKNARMA